MADHKEQYEALAVALEGVGDPGLVGAAMLLRSLPRLDYEAGMMAMGVLFIVVQVSVEVIGIRMGDGDYSAEYANERLRLLSTILAASMQCMDTICASSVRPPAPAHPSGEA